MPKKGFTHSEESKRRMSLARLTLVSAGKAIPWNKGRKNALLSGQKHPFWGKKHSEETKAKISFTKKSKNLVGNKSHLYKGKDNFRTDRRRKASLDGRRVTYAKYLIEKHLNRFLKKTEIPHHINLDHTDDRLENLFLFRHQSAHKRWHHFIARHDLPGTVLKSNL